MPLSRINSAAIANNSVIAADIAAGSVTGDKIGATAINANNIVNASITASKLATGIAAQYVDSQATAVMYYNGQNVTSNITVSADRNAFTAGPITINDPYSVTLNAGSTWVIL